MGTPEGLVVEEDSQQMRDILPKSLPLHRVVVTAADRHHRQAALRQVSGDGRRAACMPRPGARLPRDSPGGPPASEVSAEPADGVSPADALCPVPSPPWCPALVPASRS